MGWNTGRSRRLVDRAVTSEELGKVVEDGGNSLPISIEIDKDDLRTVDFVFKIFVVVD